MRVAVPLLLLLAACAVTEAPRSDAAFRPTLDASPAPSVAVPAGSPSPFATGLDALLAPASDRSSAFRVRGDAPPTWDAATPAGDPGVTSTPPTRDQPAAEPPRDDVLGKSYTELRLGWFDPHGDLGGLDSGFWGDLAFGRSFLSMLAVEASIGYFEASGGNGLADVYGIPLMINARLGVPVAIVEPYVGAGIGGVWAHSRASGFGSADGFAAMWDAFIGVELGLAGWSVGAEYRYVKSDNLDAPGGGSYQLEGNVLLLSARLPF